MNVRIPIYAEEQKPQTAEVQHVRLISLRPLFFPHPTEQDVSLQVRRAHLDYLAVVDADTLLPVETALTGTLVAVAAWVGGTRLIDNFIVR